MNINIRNYTPSGVYRFQEGGPMPEQGGGQDPMMQLIQAAAQAVQSQDCQTAMAVCQALVQLAQGGPGGPAPERAPEESPEGEPVYRRGGRLVRRVKY
jgi:hypothetical protein